jgi:glycosyltransferase involved in cell wall biosynthesis
MAEARRVLIVGSFAPSLVRFRGELIASIVGKGHSVIAAAPDISASTREQLIGLGARPHEIPLRNTSLNPISLLRSLLAMRNLIRDKRPDVILAYGIKPVIVAALSDGSRRAGTIVSLITGVGYAFTGGRELKRRVSRAAASLLYRAALKRSDVIVFLNPDDERLFRELALIPAERRAVQLDGEGLNLFEFPATPLPREASFLMIARLLKDKGVREFGEAARRLKALRPQVPITLVGPFAPSPDSISEEELQALVECGITYRGALDDVRPAIAECSVYVLPSYREGTPRSVLEAMAMGRPIITTDAPGCRETVINGENGILVSPRDSDSLYRAMMRFIDEPGLSATMGKESRKLAESRFEVHKVNEKLLRYAGLGE